jgi:hypothetical protein
MKTFLTQQKFFVSKTMKWVSRSLSRLTLVLGLWAILPNNLTASPTANPHSEDTTLPYQQELNNNTPKILVLIIASDDKPVYVELQKIWKAYMHLDKEHVEAYFIRGNPDLSTLYQIQDDIIWSKTRESTIPGILTKTLLSMECLLPRIDQFDYVVRTNLSSFYVFPRLLEFLKTLPKEKCYCANVTDYGTFYFGSGAGFILSPDLVKKLVENKKTLLEQHSNLHDDVRIGLFFHEEGIPLQPAPRLDLLCLHHWDIYKNSIPQNIFHLYAKNLQDHLRLTDEITIQKGLLKMFYNISLSEDSPQ